ncbi:VIT family protein [Dellaglioa sp. P0083]|uniref:VIT1/CCC1 transporter family protein n=1 Tax=Dellaglioa kimchii TaxID=3344667 RepID=UPI0038D4F2C4
MTSETKIKQKKYKTMDEKLNSLRAGILGSNDGILTVVGVLFSVAAATTDNFIIFIAGLTDLIACAFSMAAGEYASVSSQSDTEKAAVAVEKQRMITSRADQIHEVQNFYTAKGVSEETSFEIATELMQKKPLETIINVKYGLELGHYMNPWDAAFSSLISAALGGIFPLLAIIVLPNDWKMIGTIIAVSVAVALTAFISSKLGDGKIKVAIIRNIIIGLITMLIHYGIGQFF